ncbi:MAG: metalloregulator ArsR/SmtB family transcription factor [Paracoccaceae bacterium]
MTAEADPQMPAEPESDPGCVAIRAEELESRAQDAAAFLKALAHEGRLMILCYLSSGEKSVTELENLLESRQAAVSQQLARLRLEGLVNTRREGKVIYYSLGDPRAARLVGELYDIFCGPNAGPDAAPNPTVAR